MRLVRYTPATRRTLALGDSRPVGAQIEERRSVRSTHVAAGTLACNRCDAPVAAGPSPLSITDQLTCPFCGQQGRVRDFLSLATPTRAAHVVVRVSLSRQ